MCGRVSVAVEAYHGHQTADLGTFDHCSTDIGRKSLFRICSCSQKHQNLAAKLSIICIEIYGRVSADFGACQRHQTPDLVVLGRICTENGRDRPHFVRILAIKITKLDHEAFQHASRDAVEPLLAC